MDLSAQICKFCTHCIDIVILVHLDLVNYKPWIAGQHIWGIQGCIFHRYKQLTNVTTYQYWA